MTRALAVVNFQVLFILGKTVAWTKLGEQRMPTFSVALSLVTVVWECTFSCSGRSSAVQCAVVSELWAAVIDLCPKALVDSGLKTECRYLDVCRLWGVIKDHISTSRALYKCVMKITTMYRTSLFWEVWLTDSCQPNCKKAWKSS